MAQLFRCVRRRCGPPGRLGVSSPVRCGPHRAPDRGASSCVCGTSGTVGNPHPAAFCRGFWPFARIFLQRGFSYGPPCRSFSCGTGRLPDGLRAIGPTQYRASNFRAGPCPAAGVRRPGAACCVRKRRACPVGGRLRTGMRPETIISGSALRERPPDARWARGKASS